MRIKKAGEDRRFREIKQSFPRFLLAWTLQGLWVSFSLAAALVVITSPNVLSSVFFAIIGLIVWLIGFGIEVIADRQKSQFNADPANKGKFISTGLWSWSRHPNYFGEIVLWVGVMIIALPVLQGWQWVALISPVFITLLLTQSAGCRCWKHAPMRNGAARKTTRLTRPTRLCWSPSHQRNKGDYT